MSEQNGEAARRARPEKHSIANEPEWVVSKEEADKVAEKIRLHDRSSLVDQASEYAARKSICLDAIGGSRRRRFAEAFVLTMEYDGDYRDFRNECRNVGISIGLLLLFASIAWQVFWYWWTHRDGI